MLKYFVEFVGTFVFISVILATGKAIPIAIALAAVIYMGGHISGGNFNPAVSVAMFLQEKLTKTDMIGYILSQLAGATAAIIFYKYQQRLRVNDP